MSFLPVFVASLCCISLHSEFDTCVDQHQIADAQAAVGRVCALQRCDVISVPVCNTSTILHQRLKLIRKCYLGIGHCSVFALMVGELNLDSFWTTTSLYSVLRPEKHLWTRKGNIYRLQLLPCIILVVIFLFVHASGSLCIKREPSLFGKQVPGKMSTLNFRGNNRRIWRKGQCYSRWQSTHLNHNCCYLIPPCPNVVLTEINLELKVRLVKISIFLCRLLL